MVDLLLSGRTAKPGKHLIEPLNLDLSIYGRLCGNVIPQHGLLVRAIRRFTELSAGSPFSRRFHSSSFCCVILVRCFISFGPKPRHPRWTGHSCDRFYASRPRQCGRSKRIGCNRGFEPESQLIEQLIAGESHPCAQLQPAISSTETSHLNSNAK
jgi:hypothetical protein